MASDETTGTFTTSDYDATLHKENMVDNIPKFYSRRYRKDDGNISDLNKLLETIGLEMDENDIVLQNIRNARNVNVASGENLDKIAEIFNLSRFPGESDGDFRGRIRSTLPGYKGGGTLDQIKNAVEQYLNVQYEEISEYLKFIDGYKETINVTSYNPNKESEFEVDDDISTDTPILKISMDLKLFSSGTYNLFHSYNYRISTEENDEDLVFLVVGLSNDSEQQIEFNYTFDGSNFEFDKFQRIEVTINETTNNVELKTNGEAQDTTSKDVDNVEIYDLVEPVFFSYDYSLDGYPQDIEIRNGENRRLGFWRVNNADKGDTILDVSGNENHITINGYDSDYWDEEVSKDTYGHFTIRITEDEFSDKLGTEQSMDRFINLIERYKAAGIILEIIKEGLEDDYIGVTDSNDIQSFRTEINRTANSGIYNKTKPSWVV